MPLCVAFFGILSDPNLTNQRETHRTGIREAKTRVAVDVGSVRVGQRNNQLLCLPDLKRDANEDATRNSQVLTSSELRAESLISGCLRVVRCEERIVPETDFSHPCHRFRERRSGEGFMLVGACYCIEKGLVQLRGNAKHAAGFRRSVVESVQGVRRQNHG